MKTDHLRGKITGGIIAIVLLSLSLAVTTFALVYATLTMENQLFRTGVVEIDLNGGEPVIRENEFLFEPGMTVEKDFYIENLSTTDVYYRIYLDDVSGGLAGVLTFTIKDGDTVIAGGTAEELVRDGVPAAEEPLRIGERRDLTIVFHYPEEAGNEGQGAELYFTLCAEATQTKNNPNKLFR